MNINAFNEATKVPETVKLADLLPNKQYLVIELKIVNTQFGKRVVVHINSDGIIYAAFLPARYMKPFEENKTLISKFHTAISEESLFLEYLGGKMNNINFVVKQ